MSETKPSLEPQSLDQMTKILFEHKTAIAALQEELAEAKDKLHNTEVDAATLMNKTFLKQEAQIAMLREALTDAVMLLDRAPLNYPYNDQSNDVRVKARATLAADPSKWLEEHDAKILELKKMAWRGLDYDWSFRISAVQFVRLDCAKVRRA